MKNANETTRQLCLELLQQAKKCQTTQGAAVLLAIKRHLEGSPEIIMQGCEELWQVVDALMGVES